MQSSIPVAPELKPVKVDLQSPLFYQQLAANALAAVAVAKSFNEIHSQTQPSERDDRDTYKSAKPAIVRPHPDCSLRK